jgi:hypothetical protein
MPCNTCVDHAIVMEDKEGFENAPSYLLNLGARQPLFLRFHEKFTIQMPQNDGGWIGWAQDLIDDGAKERRLRLVTP